MQNLHIIGIPLNELSINPELEAFINDGLPTVYVGYMRDSEVTDYNFFIENNFSLRLLSDITEDDLASNRTICGLPNIWKRDGAVTTKFSRADIIVDYIKQVSAKFPNVRIALTCFADPYFYDGSYSLIQVSLSDMFNISVIRAKPFADEYLNDVYGVAALHGVLFDMYKTQGLTDTSGIFLPNVNPSMPFDYATTKTFSEIADSRALEYINKSPIIAWSGGIDSTTVLAAFVKNNIKFKVIVSPQAEAEAKELYDYVIANYDTVELPVGSDLSSWAEAGVIVTGDVCDQLYPCIASDLIPGIKAFKYQVADGDAIVEPPIVEDIYLWNNAKEQFVLLYCRYFKCDTAEGERVYKSAIVPFIEAFPVPIIHYYQLKWAIKLTLKSDYEKIRFAQKTKATNIVEAFYDNADFQRWALTNLDSNFGQYSISYASYKMPNKEYSFEVFGMQSILNKTKRLSPL